MAPEYPPGLVIFDSKRLEGNRLTGTLSYIEVPIGERLRVRWGVGKQPQGFRPVADGVAFVKEQDNLVVQPISDDAFADHLGESRYQFSEGLQHGIEWIMFILILPPGLTLADPPPSPLPAKAKCFHDRLACYWILKGDDVGRTGIECTMKEAAGKLTAEVDRINRQYLARGVQDSSSVIQVEDGSGSGRAAGRNPWISGSFYLFTSVIIIALLTIVGKMVSPWALAPILIGGTLLVTIVGALQLRNDDSLKDESFVALMVETLKRLPLLKK